jgi:hypothetical protein
VCQQVAADGGVGFGTSSEPLVVSGAFAATALQMAAWHITRIGSAPSQDMFLEEPSDGSHVLCYIDGSWPMGHKDHATRVAVDIDPQGRRSTMVAGPKERVPIVDPATVPMPVVHCGDVAQEQCTAVVNAALAGDETTYVSVDVQDYIPPCIRAQLCMHPFGGYEFSHAVQARDASNVLHGWACKWVADGSTTCRAATPDELSPFLPILRIQLVGVDRQWVYLEDSDSGMSWVAQDGQNRVLTSGSYRLATPGMPCFQCQKITPPFTGSPPPGWCSVTFSVQPGDVVSVRIRIRQNGPCSMTQRPRQPMPGSSGSGTLLTQPPPSLAATPEPCMAALFVGTLAEDPQHALGVRDDLGSLHTVVWPYGYSVQHTDLLDEFGNGVATIGDPLQMGGGEDGQGRWIVCPGDSIVRMPTASGEPTDGSLVSDSAGGFHFQRPATWTHWQPNEHNPMNDGPLAYLTTETPRPECAVQPPASPHPPDADGRACDDPLTTLSPDGVLVTWGTSRILGPLGTQGEVIDVGGAETRLTISRPGACSAIGGDETLSVRLPLGLATPVSNIFVEVCLMGPDLSQLEGKVRAMLASATR